MILTARMKSSTPYLVLFLVFYLHRSIDAALTECDPPINGCKCDVRVLHCHGTISEFPSNVPTNITEFIFDSCKFQTIHSVPYTHAVSLMIQHTSGVEIMDGAFNKLTSLSTLELQQNNMLEIRAEMFEGLSKLKVLSLAWNEITLVPEAVFANMPALEELKLSSNPKLALTPASFSGLDQLEKLELDSCALAEVPVEAVKDLEKLRVLSLGNNDIVTVPAEAFKELGSLEELHLQACDIEELEEGALDGLNSLVHLDLSGNELKEVDEDLLESSDNMKRLYLNNNQLTALADDLVAWNKLLELKIAGNPWTCDCSNAWMQALHRTAKENVTCASPPEVAGHDLHNVTLSLDCPTTDKSTIVMAVIIPLMIICACLIIYFVYKMVQTKRRREGQRNVRYSSVYKDTVETVSGGKKGKPVPEL